MYQQVERNILDNRKRPTPSYTKHFWIFEFDATAIFNKFTHNAAGRLTKQQLCSDMSLL